MTKNLILELLRASLMSASYECMISCSGIDHLLSATRIPPGKSYDTRLKMEYAAVHNVVSVLEEGLFTSDKGVLSSDEQPLPYLVLGQMVLRQTHVEIIEKMERSKACLNIRRGEMESVDPRAQQ